MLISASVALVGCDDRPSSHDPAPAPFIAKFGELVLDLPVRDDLYQARKHDTFLKVTICRRKEGEKAPAGCNGLTPPLINQYGIQVLVMEPRSATRFSLLRERPQGEGQPEPRPMLIIADEKIDKDLRGGGEAYELSRVRALSEPWLTTSLHWPVASCGTGSRGRRFCTVGFLIRGAFVEARFSTEQSDDPNQADMWRIASVVDDQLRELAR